MRKKFLGILIFLLIIIGIVGCGNKTGSDENNDGQSGVLADIPDEDPDEIVPPPVKILAIGNSFSMDALSHFYEMASIVEPNLVVGHLYKGGTSLGNHFTYADFDERAYEYFKRGPNGLDSVEPYQRSIDGILDEDWDVITIQQVSGDSGLAGSYEPFLTGMIRYIRDNATNPNLKIHFHMTWAYQQDSTHDRFKDYANRQDVMYESILYAVQNVIVSNKKIRGVIPSGTTIQNLRTSFFDDKLTRDGYHLNKYGQIAAGMTWLKYFYNNDLAEIDLVDLFNLTEKQSTAIKEAVETAIEKPFEITEAPTYPLSKEVRYMDNLHLLSIGNSFTANSYEYLAKVLHAAGVKKFVIAYIYRGGTDLQYHYQSLLGDRTSYSYHKWIKEEGKSPVRTDERQYSIKMGIEDQDYWDIITVQQVSGLSGEIDTYDRLSDVLREVKKLNNNSETKYVFHTTWAYEKGASHHDFPRYSNDQMTMYNKIIEATEKKVLTNPDISFIIPTGTSIQNLRANKTIGDNLTEDGYHLNELGKFTASMTWARFILNLPTSEIRLFTNNQSIDRHMEAIKKAVENCHNNPLKVTNF